MTTLSEPRRIAPGGVFQRLQPRRPPSERASADLAEGCIGIMPARTAVRAIAIEQIQSRRSIKFQRHNSCRHCDDSIAEHHQPCSNRFPERCDRCDIAIADRRERDDRPVHALRNARKPGLRSLDQVHQTSDHDNDGKYRRDEDRDLPPAGAECSRQHVRFLYILNQLEYSEDSQHSEDAEDDQKSSGREQDTEIGWQYRQKIYQAVETDGVSEWLSRGPQSKQIFDGERNRKAPFGGAKIVTVDRSERGDTVEHHDNDAQHNEHDEQNVEIALCVRSMLEDNVVKSRAEAGHGRDIMSDRRAGCYRGGRCFAISSLDADGYSPGSRCPIFSRFVAM